MIGKAARFFSLYQRAKPGMMHSGRVRAYCATQSRSEVELTAPCIGRIKELEKQRKNTVVLRVTVDGGGCSGFQYAFQLENWDQKPRPDTLKNEDDVLFENNGAFLIVDNISLAYMSGSKVDYAQELISSSFRVTDNPNSESSCGCGVSFSPKQ